MKNTTISSSLEDYLEAIAEIIEEQGHAHTKEIADHLKVKMPSVTNALQALSARGLIHYQSHSPVFLTPAGAETAAVIRHRHNALRNFFCDILKLPANESNDAACKVEHIIGEKVTSRIVLLSEAIAVREDCAELRAYLNQTLPQLNSETSGQEQLISLDQLPVGARGVVVKVAENLRGIKKFADLGLVSGTLLEMEGTAPLGDLMRIKVMGSSLSLRKSDAAHIWLRPAE
ncbi:MAG: metal-dependent transcriptional regulator [Victivallales bacterium]|nr:metal-dependent transcriptional regulator [Victivallales bacterium]